jgi:hypothetical protein
MVHKGILGHYFFFFTCNEKEFSYSIKSNGKSYFNVKKWFQPNTLFAKKSISLEIVIKITFNKIICFIIASNIYRVLYINFI